MTNRGKRWYGGTSGIAITVAAGALIYATPAFAQLSGGQVVGGQATISGQGTSQTTITQTSDRAIVNWDRFSLGAGDTAVFQQPDARSITVNRVTGSDPSTILGSIQANGQVVLINRNGVLFGKGSQVDTAGLIVSTHDIDAQGFLRGDSLLRFNDGGNDRAEIVVEGRITIRDAGMAAFVAPHVRNSGLILADMGRVSLAAGKGFGIDLYGDGLVRFAGSDAITGTLKDAKGQPLKALVENDGTIAARGGRILLTASAAREVVNASVNVSGIVRADSVSSQGGVITLSGSGGIGTETRSVISAAGASGGSVTITGGSVGLGGLIDASSTGVKQNGGTVTVKADGLLSLGGTTLATSSLGSGGSVTYQAGRLFENSDGRTNVSGLIDGGTIRSVVSGMAMTSGRYFADGVYGLGGRIDMTAMDLRLLSATVAATGRGGGGLVRIGGPFQGGKTPDTSQSYYQSFLGRWGDLPTLATAGHAFVNDGTLIDIASSKGQGGTAVIWSDAQTTFLGAIDARGAKGGAVEISSAQDLRRADLSHVQVGGGHLLLDPKNIIIGDLNSVQSWAYQGIIGKAYASANVNAATLKAGENYGNSVALNKIGDRLAVGAWQNAGDSGSQTGSGAVYLFTFTDANFSGGSLASILGQGYSGGKNFGVGLKSGDGFGSGVSLSADATRLAVGATGDAGNGGTASTSNTGAVYLFSFTDTAFGGASLTAKIGKGYTGGNNVDVTVRGGFGWSVALSGDGKRLAVGAPADTGQASDTSNAGAVYLFTFGDGNFTGGQNVAIFGKGYTRNSSNPKNYDVPGVNGGGYFGSSVALNADGSRLVVGSPWTTAANDSSKTNSGSVRLFTFSDANFTAGTLANTIGAGYGVNVSLDASDGFGSSVSLSADATRLAIGARGDAGYNNVSGFNTGAAYLYTFSDGNFSGTTLTSIIGKGYTGGNNVDVASLEAGDAFGIGLSLNGTATRLAVGTWQDDGAGNRLTNSGAVRLFSFADTSFTGGTLVGTIGSGYTGSRNVDVSAIRSNYFYGYATSLNANGDRLAVGSVGDPNASQTDPNTGAVYLFSFADRNFSSGSLQGIIGRGYTGGKNFDVNSVGNLEGGDQFGSSVSLNATGNRLAVGARLDDGRDNSKVDSGAVYLFNFTDTDFNGASLKARIGSGYDISVGLAGGDRFGTSVSLNGAGNLLAVGSPQNGGASGTQYGSVYLFSFSDSSFSNGTLIGVVGKGKSGSKDYNISGLNDRDQFGSSVSLNANGDLMAIGASNTASGTGAVYLMSFNNSNSSDPYKNPSLLGTMGKGYTAGGKDFNVGALNSGDNFGTAVSLNANGRAMAVGAPNASGNGAVYLFSFTDTSFSGAVKQGTIGNTVSSVNDIGLGTLDSNDQFGYAVSLNGTGNRLAVGAFLDAGAGNSAPGGGAVYLFGFSDANFTGGALLGTMGKGYLGDGGRNIDVSRLSAGDGFGTSVALNADATRMAIGAPKDSGFDGSLSNGGAVYLFTFNDGNFNGGTLAGIVGKGYFGGKNVNVGSLQSDYYFGQSVALNGLGNRMAVGASGAAGANGSSGTRAGAVYLFSFTDTDFNGGVQQAVLGKGYTGGKNYDVSVLDAGVAFGHAVSFNSTGTLLAVGAHGDAGASKNVSGAGAVYLFSFTDANFSGAALEAILGKGYSPTGSTPKYRDVAALQANDYFGVSVSLNAAGDKLAVGAFADDGYNNGNMDAGAVYIFSFDNSQSNAPFSSGVLQSVIGKGYSSSTGSKNVDIGELGVSDAFGVSVSLNATGDRVAVGAWGDGGFGDTTGAAGAVYLISFSDTNLTGGSVTGIIGKGYAGGKNVNVGALETGDRLGRSVALASNGARLVVGAFADGGFGNVSSDSGAAYLFSFADTSFTGGKLMGTVGKGYTGGKNVDVTRLRWSDRFGASVSLNARGDRLAVGAVGDDTASNSATDVGAVYLFSFTDTNFTGGTLQAILGSGYSGGKNVNVGSLGRVRGFGTSVALSGDATTLAVGATSDSGANNNSPNSGSVYLFNFTDTSFSEGTQSGKLGKGYGSADGSASVNVSGLQAFDLFGSSVSLNAAGTRLAVGAPGDQSGTGAVYLFNLALAGTSPVTLGKSKALDVGLSAGSNFGSSVSLNAIGDRLAVGAVNDRGSSGSGSATGAVYLFGLSVDGSGNYTAGNKLATIGVGYTGSGNVNVGLNAGDQFGSAVSLNALGDRLAIGASGDDGAARSSASNDYGAAYIFDFINANYSSVTRQSVLGKGYGGGKNVDVAALDPLDHFGAGISLNAVGDLLAVGSMTDAGASNLLSQSGAVYLFSAVSHNAMTQSYGFESADTVTLKASDIAAQLAAGTVVSLQASNDITVNSPITVSSGSGGDLSLAAGRSVLINANITNLSGAFDVYANDTADHGVIASQRDAGAAEITMAPGTAIRTASRVTFALGDGVDSNSPAASGIITLRSVSTGDISIFSGGTVVLPSGAALIATGTSASATTSSSALRVVTQRFVNNAGSSALSAPNGRWLVWSANPANDTVGGLDYAFKQYNYTSLRTRPQATGNALVYTLAPTLGATLGAYTKTYDGSTTATVTGLLTATGVVGGDIVTLASTGATFDTKDAGSGKTVTASGLWIGSATIFNGIRDVPVYGYTLTPTSVTNTASVVNQAALTITGGTQSVTYDRTAHTNGYTITNGTLYGSDSVTGVSGLGSGTNAGRYADTLSNATGSGLSNYAITYVNGALTIDKAVLSISGTSIAAKTYDRTTSAGVVNAGTLSGLIGSETLGVTGNAAALSSKNVGSYTTTVSYTLADGGNGGLASNYSLGSTSGLSAEIIPAALTLSGSFAASDRVYDATTSASVATNGLSMTGVASGDSVSFKTSGATGHFADKNVGTNKTVTLSASGVLTGADAGNYVLAAGAPTATATITPASLSVGGGFTASDRIYDATTLAAVTTNSLTLSGIVGSDVVSLKTSGATGRFADKNVGTNKTVTLSASGVLTGADAGNYVLASGAPTATATITPASLTLGGSFTASDRIYDTTTVAAVTTNGLTLSGVLGSDAVSLKTSNATGNFANKNAGTNKTVSLNITGVLTGADMGNYVLAAGAPTATATITPASLVISGVSATNKIYDGTIAADLRGGTITVFGGDAVTLSTANAAGTFANKNVGTGKGVTASGYAISGTDAGNYALVQPTGLTADIAARILALSGSFTAQDKVYDATTTTASIDTSGLSLSNAVAGDDIHLSLAGATGSFANKNVGNGKVVTLSTAGSLTGADAGNYSFSVSAPTTTANITPASLMVTGITVVDKVYDAATTATLTGGTVSSLGSDAVTLVTTGATGSFADKNVGTGKAVIASGYAINGPDAGNYSLVQPSGVTGTITAKLLSIGAPSIAGKSYDGATAPGTLTIGSLTGLVGSETLDVTGTATALSGKNVGSYTTTVTYVLADGSHGGLASNYTLSATSGVSAIITAKSLAVTGVTVTGKVYDGTAAATLNGGTLSGLVSGDTVLLTNGRGLFADKNVGTAKAVSASGYTISGTDAGNYALIQPTGMTADIAARTLGVSGSFTALDKVYDATTTASIDTSGLGLSNALAGDDVGLNLAGASGRFADKNVGAGKLVTLSTAGSLTGADAGNYSFAASAPTTMASITPATLNVVGVGAQAKVYDASTVASLTGGSVRPLGSDVVVLVTTGAVGAFADKNVGTGKLVSASGYAISGTDAGNYTLAQPTGLTADITRATLSVMGVTVANKVYDATTAAILSAGGVTALGRDVVTLSTAGATGAFADKNVGTGKAVTTSGYAISGTDAGNYTLVQPTGLTANITQASLLVTGVTVANKVYDAGTSATLSGGAVAALSGDVVTLVTASATGNFATKNVGTGKAVTASGYTISGTDAGNYALIQPVGLTGNIAKADLTVTGVTASSKTYDGTDTASLSGGGVAVLGGDVVTLSTSGAFGRFASKNAGAGKVVTASGYTISGVDAGNYMLIQPVGLTATIDPRSLAVSGRFTAQDKVYDATTTASIDTSGLSLANAAVGDDVRLNLNGATGHFASKTVGNAKLVTLSTAGSLVGADADNYVFNASAPTTTANITPATLNVVGVSALDKVYDANVATGLTGGSVTALGSDVVTLVTSGATAFFADKNAGSGKVVTASGYAISGTDAGNYTLVQPTGLTANISQAVLTVTGVIAQNKVYDATTTAALSGGTVTALGQDAVTLSTLGAAGRFDDKNVGSGKRVSVSGYSISGADAGNYILGQPTGLMASITPATLSVVGVRAANKTYDANTLTSLSGGAVTAFGGDAVTLVTSGASGNFRDKNVGAGKTVLASGYALSGADAGNYLLAQPVGLTADIGRATLAVTGVTARNKVYDAGVDAALTGGVVSALPGDVVTLLTGSATGRFADKNVGNAKAVTASGYTISGTDAGNYTLVQPIGLSADISRASLTVQGVSVLTKVYDATVDATLTGGTVSALGADTVILSTSAASGRFADRNAGVGKAVTASGYVISGADAGNYLLVQPTGLSGAITPASLTLAGSFTARNKVYDASVAAQVDVGGLSLAGMMAGDAVGLDLSGATGAFADKNVGTAKRVTLDSIAALTGADAGNYRLVSTALTTTADITPANLAVLGVTVRDKVYDATTAATLMGGTVSALGGDVVTLSAAGADGRFADKNVGAAKMVTASGYAISGADAQNYYLIQPTGLTGTVTRAALVVNGMAVRNRSYDAGTDATFTGGAVQPLAQDAVGLDTRGGQARFADKNVGNGKTVTIAGLTLTGADAGNYALVQPTGLTADITPAQLVVTGARASDKVYDANTLAAISGGSVTAFAGDSVTLDRAGVSGAFADRRVGGGKAVTVSGYTLGGVDAGNYTIVQPTGLTATITPARLNVQGVTVANKVYDGGGGAATSGGFVTALAPDTVALVTTGAVARFEDRNVGAGKTVIATGYTLAGADAGNYTIVQPTGLTADITRLASVVWTGKGDGKSWFDPANWAGRAIPDGANVADVVLPASTAINFDGAGRVLIDRLLTTPDADTVRSSTDTVLTLLKGNLVVAKDLRIDTLVQRGGALTGAGHVTVLDGFTQTGGGIAVTGDVAIHQGAGDLETLSISGRDVTLVGDQAVRAGGTDASRDLTIIAGGDAVLGGPTHVGRNLSVTAGKNGAGRILQDRYVTVTGDAVLKAVGDITLTNSGNHFGGTVSCTSGSGKISGSCTAGGLIDQARIAADNLAARAAVISSASGGGLGATAIGVGSLFTGGPATAGALPPGAPAFEAMASAPVSADGTGVAALLKGEPADATIAGGAGKMLTDAAITSKADITYVTARFGDQDAKAVYRQVVPQTNLGDAVYYVGN
ncbi:YDG domain-containing protein [Sphingomonas sp. 2378]|uniref:YDG domain-containing protein n=1 Tax=Sphingomonas sp. 2378 TaxID=1219748 RepID=UPI00311B09B9